MSQFDEIRCYKDDEVSAALQRLVKEEGFIKAVKYFYPEKTVEELIAILLKIDSVEGFQVGIMKEVVHRITLNTCTEVTTSGLDNLDPDGSYLFVSNHRDIIVDSAFLNYLLVVNGFSTTEIAIGSNLLIYPWITDLVKVNKSFIVNRNVPPRELLRFSQLMSLYMRERLTKENNSIWIAQREGRAKDGDDRTQTALIKMFDISGQGDFADNYKELKIVPLAINYELDPCDTLKANELSLADDYTKTEADDMKSMMTGVVGKKGRVHYAFGKPLSASLDVIGVETVKNQRYELLAQEIDSRIFSLYKLFPINYICADRVNGNKLNASHYTQQDISFVNAYFEKKIESVKGDASVLLPFLEKMYANPAINQEEK